MNTATKLSSAPPEFTGSISTAPALALPARTLQTISQVIRYVNAVNQEFLEIHAAAKEEGAENSSEWQHLAKRLCDTEGLEKLARVIDGSVQEYADPVIAPFHSAWCNQVADPCYPSPHAYARLFSQVPLGNPAAAALCLDTKTSRGRLLNMLLCLSPLVGTAALLAAKDFESPDSVLQALQRQEKPPCRAPHSYLQLLEGIAALNDSQQLFSQRLAQTSAATGKAPPWGIICAGR